MFIIINYYLFSSCEYNYAISKTNSSIDFIPEISNSVTSIFTSILGLFGLLNSNEFLFIVNMTILIILGLSSFLHHYYYRNNYFWEADILSIELVIFFIEFYLFNYSYYLDNIYSKVKILFIIVNFLMMVILNNNNIELRTYLLKSNIVIIILKQTYNCYKLYKIKEKNFSLFLKFNLVNFVYFLIASTFWYIDKLCIFKFHKIINSHSVWHIFISLALFNTININNFYICILEKRKFKIHYLFKKLPYLAYLVFEKKIKIETCNNSTFIELKDMVFINVNENCKHKRIKSFS